MVSTEDSSVFHAERRDGIYATLPKMNLEKERERLVQYHELILRIPRKLEVRCI